MQCAEKVKQYATIRRCDMDNGVSGLLDLSSRCSVQCERRKQHKTQCLNFRPIMFIKCFHEIYTQISLMPHNYRKANLPDTRTKFQLKVSRNNAFKFVSKLDYMRPLLSSNVPQKADQLKTLETRFFPISVQTKDILSHASRNCTRWFCCDQISLLIDSYSDFVIRTRSGFRVSCRSRRQSRDGNVRLKKP